MLLAIDAGNTNIVFAVYDELQKKYSWRCKTDSGKTADEYAAWLFQLFTKENIEFSDIHGATICSVVPDANFHLMGLCNDVFKIEPFMVSYDTVKIKTALENPNEIGSDRLVNTLAVIKEYATPAIVIDFGTATTFDVIDASGTYLGGVIAPGVNLSMEALHMAAAKLPNIHVKKPEKVIGNNTVSAMQSGTFWGYASMVEGMVKRICSEINARPYVLATGGLAPLFADTLEMIDHVDQDLTLRGLVQIYHDTHKQMAA